MRRVLVIGSGGAGKSTFARRLAGCIGLPLVHLDALYWKPVWVATPQEEWDETLAQLLAGDRWIIDGNYGRTLEQRLLACDTVIFLDLPRVVCLWRVIVRRVRFRGRSRTDMRAGCPERLTWEFIRWIWKYPVERRPKILERLRALGPNLRVLVFRSSSEVESFLRGLEGPGLTGG